jgi:hypothetical protein
MNGLYFGDRSTVSKYWRHPTEIADSTLPSLWSNADFRRANIALSDGGSITPCLAEVLRLSKL